jgi:hypothetical protein
MQKVPNPTSTNIHDLYRSLQLDLQDVWGSANSREEYDMKAQYLFDRYVDIAQRVTVLSIDEIIKGLRSNEY